MFDALSDYTSVSSRRKRQIHRPTEVDKAKDRIPKPVEAPILNKSKTSRDTFATRRNTEIKSTNTNLPIKK